MTDSEENSGAIYNLAMRLNETASFIVQIQQDLAELTGAFRRLEKRFDTLERQAE